MFIYIYVYIYVNSTALWLIFNIGTHIILPIKCSEFNFFYLSSYKLRGSCRKLIGLWQPDFLRRMKSWMRFREVMMQMFRKHQRIRKVSRVKFSKIWGLQLCLKIRYFIEVLFMQKTCFSWLLLLVIINHVIPCSQGFVK